MNVPDYRGYSIKIILKDGRYQYRIRRKRWYCLPTRSGYAYNLNSLALEAARKHIDRIYVWGF